MKILWITNMPTIYRVHFFNELGKLCDLTVLFERYSATGVENRWQDSMAYNFKACFHKTVNVGREGAFGFGLLSVNYKLFDHIIISSYSSPAEILALCKLKLQRIPYILEVDGGIIKNESWYKKKLKTFLISGAKLYFSTSDKTTEYLHYYGAEASKVVKYHFTSLFDEDIADSICYNKQDVKRELGINTEKMVLAVGQFIPRKGFDVLLRAAPQILKNTMIVIIGGVPTAEYRGLTESLGLKNIRFINEIFKPELDKYYQAADVFVLPTREDIWGLVINEAMAKGLPIITTNKCVAGLELISDGENGFIVASEDASMLARKINVVLKNDGLAVRMAENNLKKIKRYTFRHMAKEHYDIFVGRNKK